MDGTEWALGAFVLETPLGQGGMGQVWRARHAATGAPAAIKCLHARGMDAASRRALRTEVQAVARLDHPHVIRIYDLGEVPPALAEQTGGRLPAGGSWFAMELADEGPLPPGPMAWPALRAALRALLDALAHAHARGVLHRDLKPDNVLRCGANAERPGLKLADFGIAHALGPRGADAGVGPTVFAGTPTYAAPEQFEGRADALGPWTDLYALGCLAYELVAGAPPFEGTSALSLAIAHRTRPVPALAPDAPVPPGFDGWLARLLEKSPAARFQRAADAAWALSALAEEAPAPAVSGSATGVATPALTTLVDLPPWIGEEIDADAPARSAAPPIPETWQARPVDDRPLPGTGLRLVRLRQIGLVGRDEEARAIWRLLGDVHRTGTARVAALVGPAGYGKSRLAQAVAERAHELGAASVIEHAHDPRGDASLPRAIQRQLPPHAASAADLEALKAWVRSPLAARGRAARYALLHRLLGCVAAERPLVVWLDDVQWGYDALSFVDHVMRAQLESPVPVLFVLTAQQEALAERRLESGALEDLLRRPGARRVEVGPLPRAEFTRLVSGLLHLEGEVAAQVEARTAGNPLFAVQLVGEWVDCGVLEPAGRGFRLAADHAPRLPPDVAAVWSARIERALRDEPPEAGPALELAAVGGRRVDPAEWRAVCAAEGLPVPEDTLDRLIERCLVLRDGEAWTFVHTMLREAFEAAAAAAGRLRGHHAAYVERLAPRFAAGEMGVAARLATHLFGSERAAEAVAPALKAARALLDQFDFRAALALLHRVDGALADAGDVAARRESDVLRAMSLLGLRELDEAAVAARQLWARDGEPGWTTAVAEAALILGDLARFRGDVALAVDWYERAIERYGQGGDRTGQARAHYCVGEATWHRAPDVATHHYAAALRFAGDGAHRAAGVAHLGLACIANERQEPAARAQHLAAARARLEAAGDPDALTSCYCELAKDAQAHGALDEALALYDLAAEHDERNGWINAAVLDLNRCTVALDAGHWAEARRVAARCHRRFSARRQIHLLTAATLVELAGAAGDADWPAWDDLLARLRAELVPAGDVTRRHAEILERAAELATAGGEPGRAAEASALAGEW